MTRYRLPVFTVETPIPNILKEVTLYEDVWEGHIVLNHPELEGREIDVENSVAQPTKIVQSQTVIGTVLFVNESVQDQTGRSLRVATRSSGATHGEVRSAYFSSETNVGELIWSEESSGEGE